MHPRDAAAGAIALGVGATTMALWYFLRRKYARKPAAPGTEHRCRVIRGDNVARRVWRDLTDDLRILREEKNVVPKLVFVTSSDTGHRHVSAAMRLLHDEVPGLRVTEHALPWGCGTTALVAAIAELNADRDVHAVSVQLPLGDDVDVSRVLGALAPEKDAEGLSDANFKEMCLKQGKPLAVPTTAIGALEVLWRFNVPLQGRRAVVIGRSNTVGLPVAQLLLHNNATVTICHSFTADMKAVVQEADILVATNGKPNTVRGDWLKEGAVVIDLGGGSVPDPSRPSGRRKVGDVFFDEAVRVASFIAPSPNGVDRLILPMLVKNSINLARHGLGMPLLDAPPGTVTAARQPSQMG